MNRYLTPGLVTGTNWRMNVGGVPRRGNGTTAASAYTVSGTTLADIPGVPMNTLTFDPPPFDVFDQTGDPLPAFAAFPLTILP